MIDKENIRVLYLGNNIMFVHGQHNTYNANTSDGVTPTEFIMPLNELIYLNGNSPVIKDGTLFFYDEDEEEIYKALKINNYKNILKDTDYQEIILNPTVEGLQKIIDIVDSSIFERVRTILFRLKLQNGFSVSSKVENLINARFVELQNRKRNSEIKIVEHDVQSKKIATKEIEDMKQQNADLQNQLAQMQAMMAQLMSMQQSKSDEVKEEVVETETDTDTATKKKAGRPTTKSTK